MEGKVCDLMVNCGSSTIMELEATFEGQNIIKVRSACRRRHGGYAMMEITKTR